MNSSICIYTQGIKTLVHSSTTIWIHRDQWVWSDLSCTDCELIGIIHINSIVFLHYIHLSIWLQLHFHVWFCCFSYSFSYPHFTHCCGSSLLHVCGSRRISSKSVSFLHPFRLVGVTKLAYVGGGVWNHTHFGPADQQGFRKLYPKIFARNPVCSTR